jgi:ribosomal protein S19E (S16A)
METFSLSPSEKLTLKHLAEGELHIQHLDWVALQRLKRLGLAEERSTGPAITQEGRRELQRLARA